ncbi:helix-turn-helix domain-containing protein [Spirillospora sp. CA-294931]|uniref:helix-turn-helix domain-containing protein n=1 Tax=Spirillospora sp. CA-294931 TaxID=3240042 RepID=UPI003D93E136
MAHENRPSVRFRRIGSALRQAREERRLTLGTASRRFGKSAGWLSTVETGQIPIRVDDLADLLDLYDIDDGPLRESLLHLAAQGRRKNWAQAREGRISAAALDLASLEDDSAHMRAFQPNLIPGLLQNEMYTRALIAAGLPSATRDPDALVAFRMARQAVLRRQPPPRYAAIIGESALHHPVGGRTTMQDQYRLLNATARLPHISLYILPSSAAACLWVAGPFDIFTLRPPGRLTVTVIEQFSQSLFIEDEQEVAYHERIFDHLLSVSLNESDSLEVLQGLVS